MFYKSIADRCRRIQSGVESMGLRSKHQEIVRHYIPEAQRVEFGIDRRDRWVYGSYRTLLR